MQIEQKIIEILLSTGTITAQVGDRIKPTSVDQGSNYPAISVSRISSGPLYADDGEIGLENPRFEVIAVANDFGTPKRIALLLQDALSGLDSDLYNIQYVMLDDERDERVAGANVAEYQYRTIQTYSAWHHPE